MTNNQARQLSENEEVRRNIESTENRRLLLESFFQDHAWPLIHALNWIAFRDPMRITDSRWHRLRPEPAVEPNPRAALLQALGDGKITASLKGTELSPRTWDAVRPHDLQRDFGETKYLKREVLAEWKNTAGTQTQKRGRRPAIDWAVVYEKGCSLMDHHGDFFAGDPNWNHQAKLEGKLADFIASNFGADAVKSESTIRQHTAKALVIWRTKKAEN